MTSCQHCTKVMLDLFLNCSKFLDESHQLVSLPCSVVPERLQEESHGAATLNEESIDAFSELENTTIITLSDVNIIWLTCLALNGGVFSIIRAGGAMKDRQASFNRSENCVNDVGGGSGDETVDGCCCALALVNGN